MSRWLLPILGIVLGTFTVWYVFPRLPINYPANAPTDHWFEVTSVEVSSAAVGTIPKARVTRLIHRPFTANWIVTLRKRNGSGFLSYCVRKGTNDYRPYARLPESTDINWWMEIPPNPACPELVPGEYILTLSWELQIDGVEAKVVKVESNVFEVIQ